MTGGGLAAADVLPGRTHHLEVTAPRFSMPGNEVFGVFPPPNADWSVRRSAGPDRAAQPHPAVGPGGEPRPSRGWRSSCSARARRRSCPTCRRPRRTRRGARRPGSRATPGAPPSRCRARPSTTPSRPPPRLELLAHVRQVDPAETEYADSDGWVSVLIANRLPQPGQAYAAYLISLEGQRDVLPPPGDVEQGGIRPGVFDDLVDLEDLLDIRVVIGGDPVLPLVGPVGPIGPVGPVRPVPHQRRPPPRRGGTGDRAAASSGVFSVTSSRLVRHDIDLDGGRHGDGTRPDAVRHVPLPGAGALGVHVLRGVG